MNQLMNSLMSVSKWYSIPLNDKHFLCQFLILKIELPLREDREIYNLIITPSSAVLRKQQSVVPSLEEEGNLWSSSVGSWPVVCGSCWGLDLSWELIRLSASQMCGIRLFMLIRPWDGSPLINIKGSQSWWQGRITYGFVKNLFQGNSWNPREILLGYYSFRQIP